MRIAITDANIFIDLFYLEAVKHLFFIRCEIITTDQVIAELEEEQAEKLYAFMHEGLLTVECITTADRQRMRELRSFRGLSESDLSVICLAERCDAIVLSGDDLVRKTCKKNQIEIHGILWCLHQFTENGRMEKTHACEMLIQLMKFNKRLPLPDCKRYIEEKWGGRMEEE
ncbi:MAG: hypothetical protein ACOZCO_02085 [Bacteroidota bacterium]